MEQPHIQNAISQCRRGNLQAFGVIYDAYIQKIYNYVYFRTHHKQTAEDITSLAFAKACQNIQSFDPAVGTMQAWLYRIARNTLIDHFRTNRPTFDIADAPEPASNPDLDAKIDNRAKLQEVYRYLNQLDAPARDLVVMRIWDQLSYAEIAEVTGKTEAALKMNMSRIMAKLRLEVAAVIIALLIFK
jgi:RNA polymerase sigma-70 factor (ECF subfamily)